MILSKEFYDQCCPTYQKVIDELEEKIAEIEEAKNPAEMNEYDQQIKAAILKFANEYLTPKEYWDHCISKLFDLGFDEYLKECYEINAIAYQHFHYDKELDLLPNPEGDGELYLKLVDFQCQASLDEGDYTADESDIRYPHNRLQECFRYFENNASRLPSTKVYKRYEEMKEMFSKIKAAEEDVEEWFKLLIEVDDDEFVKDNVEYRLGKNLLDRKLWMLYIEFLKQKEEYEDLLQVYSKYCRFFLDDIEMLKKYKSEMAKHENLVLPFSGNEEKFFKKTYITTCIDIKLVFGGTFISSLIPRLSRCDAKHIYLMCQNLSFNDFKFLVSHGQVVQYEMFLGEIKDEANAYIDLEKIMKYFYNIEKLWLPDVKVNANTAHALSNQNFNGKISYFSIQKIFGEPFDPHELLKFCVKTRDEKILFCMTFNKEFNAAFVHNLEQIMSDYVKSYEHTEIFISLND
uniref:Uncharacterized protein n=1 Tax=Panagrolaimus sp. PS1159 TaxID=55785 RepID=A0AC35F0S9_9BILA